MAPIRSLFTANLTLILLANSVLLPPLLLQSVFAIDPQRRSTDAVAAAAVDHDVDDGSNDDGTPGRKQPCNFNEERTYNATDLVSCMNELASAILQRRNINSNRITDRAYQDSRQSSYSDYSMLGGASSNYFDDDMLTSILSGALPLSGWTNLFSGFTRPGFNLFNAMSSIVQYDDLKCVPRILCEVASGSMPGSVGYRQSSGFQDYGQNSFFRLLTAFGGSGSTSPILTFGRAALLGYTNRGHPSMCYQEYPRCPRSQDQLIAYLNNHNGGFFRFFNGNRDTYHRPQKPNYYRPQQLPHRPYYREPSNDVEYRIVGSKTERPTPEWYSRPEDDRTGTGKLSFVNSDYYEREQGGENANFFTAKSEGKESSKLIFPKEDRQSYYQPNRIMKSLNVFKDLETNNDQVDSFRKDRKFFPQDDHDNHDTGKPYVIDYNRRPRTELFGNTESFIYFPHDTIQKDTSTFVIPNNYRNH